MVEKHRELYGKKTSDGVGRQAIVEENVAGNDRVSLEENVGTRLTVEVIIGPTVLPNVFELKTHAFSPKD